MKCKLPAHFVSAVGALGVMASLERDAGIRSGVDMVAATDTKRKQSQSKSKGREIFVRRRDGDLVRFDHV